MANLFPSVLYFIHGPTPTQEDLDAADALGPGVKFRNAKLIVEGAPLEACDGVAGGVDGDGNSTIPADYAEAFPDAAKDREGVRDRMMARNPALASMIREAPASGPRESEEARRARIQNAISRGEQNAPVNERNSEPALASHRVSQAGGPRVIPTAPNDGWGTNPAELAEQPAGPEGGGEPGGQPGQPAPESGEAPNGGTPAQPPASPSATPQAPAAPSAPQRAATPARRTGK